MADLDNISAELELLSISTCSTISEEGLQDIISEISMDGKLANVPSKVESGGLGDECPTHHQHVHPTALKKTAVILKGNLQASVDQSQKEHVIHCLLNTEEDGDVEGKRVPWSLEYAMPNSEELNRSETGSTLQFALKNISLFFQSQRKIFHDKNQNPYEKSLIVITAKSNKPHSEWHYLMQMRISTASDKTPLRVVDSDIFEFGSRVTTPILIDVDDVNVNKAKFELRYIRQVIYDMPDFLEVGDTLLIFPKESTMLRAHGSLLALHSPKLSFALDTSPINKYGMKELKIEECTSAEFRELLWQLYPTNRPVFADFRKLCHAALTFSVRRVINSLVEHLINYQHLDFLQKIREAIKLNLFDAVVGLVYNAVKSGGWAYMINAGFDPTKEFSEDICVNFIYPAVLSAKSSSDYEAFRPKCPVYNFVDAKNAKDPNNVQIRINGRTFFVNKGVLAMHNDTMFGRGNYGEFYPLVTLDLRNELENRNLGMEDVMIPLLTFMYVGNARMVKAEFVRPLIIFAATHHMRYVLQQMEELLIEEPPVSPTYMFEHLWFAERYQLDNLLRVTLFRMESSYRDVAQALINEECFKQLTPQTQRLVHNRLCCGWAAFGAKWAGKRRGTPKRERRIAVGYGGSVPCPEEAPSTLHAVDSDHMFGPKLS